MTSVDPAVNVPPRRGSRAGRMLAGVCVLAVCVLLLIATGVLPSIIGFLAIGLVLSTIFWQVRTHLPSILLVFVTVMLVSVVITRGLPKLRPDRTSADDTERLSRSWATSGRFDQKLPIVVHLIMDEMMSPGAMTDDLPNGSATRQSLVEFGAKHSFRMFDSVYSRYYYTSDSLGNLMQREYRGQTGMDSFVPFLVDDHVGSFAVKGNSYFKEMADRGYRTIVFQSAHIDFCADENVDRCETFDSYDPGGKDPAGVNTPTQRVSLWQTILRAYEPSYTSEIGHRILGRVYGLRTREVGVMGAAGRYDAQGFPQWFDRFSKFAPTVPRGTHIFAHFLVPHSPYLLLENCVVSGKLEEGYNLSKYPPAERAGKRSGYYERYFAQLRCVQKKLDDFMTVIEQSENFKDAVIIVHGDHGSRISVSNVLEDYGSRDFVDNYATFFAVRAPGVSPGVDCEFTALPEVFRRYAATGGRTAPPSGAPLPVVVLSREAGNTMVGATMPAFGCAAGQQNTAPAVAP
jgi:hypothetical protein